MQKIYGGNRRRSERHTLSGIPRSALWVGPLCLLWAGLLTGCQSYEAKPLDPLAHGKAWQERTFGSVAPGAYLRRFGEAPETEPQEWSFADGVTLKEAQLLAWVFNPDVRLMRMDHALAGVEADWAGRLQDPTYALDLLRIKESVPHRWVIGHALEFALPVSGANKAQREVAQEKADTMRAKLREEEWSLRHSVEEIWWQLSEADQRLAAAAEYVEVLADLHGRAQALAEVGELDALQANLFELESMRVQALQIRLRGDRASAEQILRQAIGVAPSAALEFIPEWNGPQASDPMSMEAMTERSPHLAHFRKAYDLAESELRLAIRKQYPDFQLGPQWESDAGTERFGFVASLPVPLWNRGRGAIARARSARERARVAYEVEWERVAGQWQAAQLARDAVAEERAYLEGELTPKVDAHLQQAMTVVNLGEGDSFLSVDALRTAFEVKQELIAVQHREARAYALLRHLGGPNPEQEPVTQRPTDSDGATASTEEWRAEESNQ